MELFGNYGFQTMTDKLVFKTSIPVAEIISILFILLYYNL